MQTKKELDNWYQKKDPWDYENNQWDKIRIENIINAINLVCDYKTILDIGAGEGLLTKELPGKAYAIELSDIARERIPTSIITKDLPDSFDAVISTGTLYRQYDHEDMARQIREKATQYVIISGIKDWLVDYDFGKIIYQEEFPYREYTQKLTIYEINPPHSREDARNK